MTLSCSKLKGEFTRDISVDTNDPEHASVKLLCKGQVKEPFAMEPSNGCHFGRVSRAETPKKTVIITQGDAGPLKLTLKPFSEPGIGVKLREVIPGERYELDVSLDGPFTAERVSAVAEFETGVSEIPTANVKISAYLAPRVTAIPRRYLVPPTRSADWEQPVVLKWDDAAPHKVLAATVSDPTLAVVVEDHGAHQEVVLKVPKDFVARTTLRPRVVTITTDDPQSPTLTVPISVRDVASLRGATRHSIEPPVRGGVNPATNLSTKRQDPEPAPAP